VKADKKSFKTAEGRCALALTRCAHPSAALLSTWCGVTCRRRGTTTVRTPPSPAPTDAPHLRRYHNASERLHLPGTLVGDKSPKAPQLTHANLVGAGDIDGPYLIANVGDALLISDFNCIGKVRTWWRCAVSQLCTPLHPHVSEPCVPLPRPTQQAKASPNPTTTRRRSPFVLGWRGLGCWGVAVCGHAHCTALCAPVHRMTELCAPLLPPQAKAIQTSRNAPLVFGLLGSSCGVSTQRLAVQRR